MIWRGIFDYNSKKLRILEIDLELLKPETWKKKESIYKLNKEKNLLNIIVDNINKIEAQLKETNIFVELAKETKDNTVIKDIITEVEKIEEKILVLGGLRSDE